MNFNNQKDKNRIKKPRTPEIKNMNNKNSKGFIKDNITKYKNAKRPGTAPHNKLQNKKFQKLENVNKLKMYVLFFKRDLKKFFISIFLIYISKNKYLFYFLYNKYK